jgi:hypothetical protein
VRQHAPIHRARQEVAVLRDRGAGAENASVRDQRLEPLPLSQEGGAMSFKERLEEQMVSERMPAGYYEQDARTMRVLSYMAGAKAALRLAAEEIESKANALPKKWKSEQAKAGQEYAAVNTLRTLASTIEGGT